MLDSSGRNGRKRGMMGGCEMFCLNSNCTLSIESLPLWSTFLIMSESQSRPHICSSACCGLNGESRFKLAKQFETRESITFETERNVRCQLHPVSNIDSSTISCCLTIPFVGEKWTLAPTFSPLVLLPFTLILLTNSHRPAVISNRIEYRTSSATDRLPILPRSSFPPRNLHLSSLLSRSHDSPEPSRSARDTLSSL